jgi:hypothetical protein
MHDDFADSVAQINALGHVIPPADADLLLDQKYRTAVSALNQRPASASSPCLVCGKEHRFDDCPVLKDVDYLKDHYNKFCSFLKRTIASRKRLTQSAPPFLAGPSAEHHVPRVVKAISYSEATSADQLAFRRDQDFYWRQV